MSVSTRHLRHQWPVIASLGRTVISAATASRRRAPGASWQVPGPELTETLPPRPPDLVRDFVRHVGGDPATYRHTLPPHLFPQWTFPLAARTLLGAPYPIARALNGGCRLEVRAALPRDEPLHVRARLEEVDDNGRRVVLRQRVVTGAASAPDAIVADLYAIIPLAKKGAAPEETPAEKREKPRVPEKAQELALWRLGPDAGRDFAVLTGDINPVHWLRPYARAFGFKSVILHGFATMSRTFEGLTRTLLAGQGGRIGALDVRFTRPLLLPAQVGLYIDGNEIFVGDAPGGPAYLTGHFELRDHEVRHG